MLIRKCCNKFLSLSAKRFSSAGITVILFIFTLELLARLMNDFAEMKPEYYSLGVQLKVPVYIIEEIKSDTGDRLAKIFDHWLHNTQEDLWFEQLCTALQQMHRSDLAAIVKQKYMIESTEGIYMSYINICTL